MARALPFVAAAMCLLAPTVRADEPRRPPTPPAEQQKPLSAEDAEVVKQLTLLEQVELLRNLDLFAPGPTDAQPGKEPADAGTR